MFEKAWNLWTSRNFKKILLNTEFAVSHVCPKYNLESLDKGMIKQAIERTYEKVEFIILDWKGLGKEKKLTGFKWSRK